MNHAAAIIPRHPDRERSGSAMAVSVIRKKPSTSSSPAPRSERQQDSPANQDDTDDRIDFFLIRRFDADGERAGLHAVFLAHWKWDEQRCHAHYDQNDAENE